MKQEIVSKVTKPDGSMLKLLTLIALLIFAVACQINSAELPGSDPEKLVALLGSESFLERQDAAKKLLAMGRRARGAVKSALENENLEVRVRAEKIWKKIRWAVYPGELDNATVTEMDALAETLKEVQGSHAVNVGATWNSLFARNGGKTLGLLIAIHEAYPKDKEVVGVGLKMLIDRLDAEALSEAIDGLPNEGSEQALIEILSLGVSGSMRGEQYAKLMRVSLKLGEIQLAVSCGASAWSSRKDVKLVEEIADAVRDGKQEALWQSVNEIFELEGGDQLARASFCITLAALLENRDTAKGLVEKLEMPDKDAGTLVLLHEQLSKLELAHLLTPSLVNSEDPQVLYLAHLALRDQGKEAESDAAWEKVFVNLKQESQCYQLGEKMGKMGDNRRERVWRKILEMDPVNSVYDANAHFRLAPMLESQGKFAEAADHMEAAMKDMKGALIMTRSDGKTVSGKEAEDWVYQNIKNLRERAKKAE